MLQGYPWLLLYHAIRSCLRDYTFQIILRDPQRPSYFSIKVIFHLGNNLMQSCSDYVHELQSEHVTILRRATDAMVIECENSGISIDIEESDSEDHDGINTEKAFNDFKKKATKVYEVIFFYR